MGSTRRKIIGFDIGGSKIRGVLWDGTKVVRAVEVPTPRTRRQFEEKLQETFFRLKCRDRIVGIAVGMAGVTRGATLKYSPNISYARNLQIKNLFPSSCAIRLDNDARSFLRGHLAGSAKGSPSILGVTLGTGLGRAVAIAGRVRTVPVLERPESWEKKYQKLRDRRQWEQVADLLIDRLPALMRRYKAKKLVLGGGLMRRGAFTFVLRRRFKEAGLGFEAARRQKNAGAIGAALLFAKR